MAATHREYDLGGMILLGIFLAIALAGLAFWLWDWFHGKKISSGTGGRPGGGSWW